MGEIVVVALLSAGGYWVYHSHTQDKDRRRQYVTTLIQLSSKLETCRTSGISKDCDHFVEDMLDCAEAEEDVIRKVTAHIVRENCDAVLRMTTDEEVLDWLIETEGECFLDEEGCSIDERKSGIAGD